MIARKEEQFRNVLCSLVSFFLSQFSFSMLYGGCSSSKVKLRPTPKKKEQILTDFYIKLLNSKQK